MRTDTELCLRCVMYAESFPISEKNIYVLSISIFSVYTLTQVPCVLSVNLLASDKGGKTLLSHEPICNAILYMAMLVT